MTPLARPRAVVFDLDGTVVDNMALHAEAFSVFAERHGLPPLTADDRAKTDGRRNSEIFPLLFGREMTREEWLAYEDEKEGLYREVSKGRVVPVAGLTTLLDRAVDLGMAVALATSAPALNVAHTLGEVGLLDRFPVIVRGDQVGRGKPAPDVFIEASRLVDVPAAECLVFEDAPIGVVAARAAGMPVVGLTTTFSAEYFRGLDVPPDVACGDFHEFLTLAGW